MKNVLVSTVKVGFGVVVGVAVVTAWVGWHMLDIMERVDDRAGGDDW